MKPDVVRCACCGFQVLRRELDEYGNGPCCPSSTRKPRSDKGKTREEVKITENETSEQGLKAGESGSGSPNQMKLF